MPIKKYKPTTPGRRGMTSLSREEITCDKPEMCIRDRIYPVTVSLILLSFCKKWIGGKKPEEIRG